MSETDKEFVMKHVSLDQLNHQLSVLKEDERKTKEKASQIIGAITVIEFLILEASKDEAGTPNG